MINYKLFTVGIEEEYMVIDPTSKELISHEQKIVIENGSVICPTGPGLGVDINEKMVNKYRIEHLS